MKKIIPFFLISFIIFSFQNVSSQKNWYVDDNSNVGDVYTITSIAGNDANAGTANSPLATLQKAIDSAVNGDLIYVDKATFDKSNGNRSLNINKSVTIVGAGIANTIFTSHTDHRFATINANNVKIQSLKLYDFFYGGSSNGQVLLISNNITGFELENVWLSNNFGSTSKGESIYLSSGTSSIFRGLLFSCSGYNGASGGAIKVNNASLLLSNCLVKQAQNLGGDGGAIEMFGSNPQVTISNCTFDNCSAYSGGAISQSSGDLTVTGSCFSNNHISADNTSNTNGGGHYIAKTINLEDSATFTNCSFTGAYFCGGTIPSGSDCMFDSSPSNDGKSIALRDANGVFNFNTCTFNNANVSSSFDNGLDFYLDKGTSINVTINNCSFGNDQFGTASGGNAGSDAINIWNQDLTTSELTITNSGTVQTTANQDNILGNNVSFFGTLPATTNNNLPTSLANASCYDASALAGCAAAVNCATETLAPIILQCVSNKVITDCSGVLADYTPEVAAFDDCSFTVTQSIAPGTTLLSLGNGTQTITMTVTDQAGNTSTCTFTITLSGCVACDPGVLSGNQNICGTGTTDFDSTVAGGTFSSSNTAIAIVNAATGVITGVAAGMATITYTTGVGCSTTRDVTVTNAPNAGSLAALNTTLCTGTTSYIISTIAGGTWTSSNNNIATVDANTGFVYALSEGTATITYNVVGTAGCAGTNDTATVDIMVTNTDAPTGSSSEFFCELDTPTVADLVAYASGVIRWYSTPTGGFPIDYDTALSTGIYYASQTQLNCESTSRLLVAVSILTKLTPTFQQVAPIKKGDNLDALPTTSYNGISGVWSPALDNSQTTTYTFSPNIGECAEKTTMTIVVDSTLSIETISSKAHNISVFPNPFTKSFKISFETASLEMIDIKVFDLIGKQIENKLINPTDLVTKEFGENYSDGVYNVIISQGKNIQTMKIIKIN